MNVRSLGLAIVLAASALVPVATRAAAPSEQLQISANVAKSCDFDPIPSIALGNYDWHAGIFSTIGGELTVKCNVGVVYWFTADRGLNPVSSWNGLSSGTSTLLYTLLVQEPDMQEINPAANSGPGAQLQLASGKKDTYGITIVVPAAQMVPAGQYADTVTFSLNY
jgi:spore coat protein U-like protein